MHQTEPATERPPQDRPPQEQPVPPCIAFVLHVVRVLLRYGRQLDETLPTKADHPRFSTLAAGFGTHDVRRILAHIQRGILRAMMLERYLLARAAQDRDIEPIHPPEPAEPAEIDALDLKLRPPSQPRPKPAQKADPDDPLHFSIPTLKELESQVRRRPVGRTIAEICMDLGVTPSACDGATWDEILQVLTHFGANLAQFFGIQQHRREAFQDERDKRPETWTFDWRDRPREVIRQILGYLLGDPIPPTRWKPCRHRGDTRALFITI
jgi:hypothetical protein